MFIYNIEIAGTCNLQCPSCARGSAKEIDTPKGFLDIKLYEEILNKIESISFFV